MWDQALEIPEVLSTTDGDLLLYGLDLLGLEHNGAWYYPQTDALGSLRQWTDANGMVVGQASFDPFGGFLSQQGFTSSWGFAGEYHDPATGLQYLRARWYQPGVGRFTQGDPFPGVLALPLTQHPYGYAANNPVLYTDPSGKIINLVSAALIGAGAGFAVGVGAYALSTRHFDIGEALTVGGTFALAGGLIAIGAGGTAGLEVTGALFPLSLGPMPLSTATIFSGAGIGMAAAGLANLFNNWLSGKCFDTTEFLVNSFGGGLSSALTAAIPGVGLAPTVIRALINGAAGAGQYALIEGLHGRALDFGKVYESYAWTAAGAFWGDALGQLVWQGVPLESFSPSNLPGQVENWLYPSSTGSIDLRHVYSPLDKVNEFEGQLSIATVQAIRWTVYYVGFQPR